MQWGLTINPRLHKLQAQGFRIDSLVKHSTTSFHWARLSPDDAKCGHQAATSKFNHMT